MIITDLPLAGAKRIEMEPKGDARGFFARSFCSREFGDAGLATHFVQMNTSLTRQVGTIRGLHFQRPPAAEVKMVRCLVGAVFDVIVDLRAGSPTYGRWCAETLTAENRRMIYIPAGFAHGFQTLLPETELLYLHDTHYAPGHEGGLFYADKSVAIDWPLPAAGLSERDAALPPLSKLEPIAQ